MAVSFKAALKKLGLKPFKYRWVLIAACATFAWLSLRSTPETAHAPAAPASPSAATSQYGPVASATSRSGPPAAPEPQPGSPYMAGVQPLVGSSPFGMSTINVIVHHNDTLDGIFRRLRLSLTDLASLRGLPGLKARLDSLRPGESLRLMHRDGSLFGFERRLNEEQTLKVSRDAAGLKADVLQNPLDARPRNIRASLNSSLFEAVEAAGGHDLTAVALSDLFGRDLDFVLDIRPGDSFIVSYQELYQDGVYVKDWPGRAAAGAGRGRAGRAGRGGGPG